MWHVNFVLCRRAQPAQFPPAIVGLMVRVIAVFLICALAPLAYGADYTALDRYVASPDPSFRYTLVQTVNSPGLVAYQLDMVSQTWLTSAEVDKPVWRHWVTIYKPDQLTTSTVVLFIDGGTNSTSPPSPDPLMMLLAAGAGAVVVDLGQVPNEPLTFAGESQSRTEDAIIAYTWDKYLRTGDERWPAEHRNAAGPPGRWPRWIRG